MEIILKKSGKYRGVRVLVCCLFLSFLLPANQLVAGDTTATTSASDTLSSAGPSLSNLKKTMAAGDEEAKKIQEEQRKQDIINWVIMIVGFSLVIAVAWFTTSLAKKRRIVEDEKRAKRAAAMQLQNPHRKTRR